MLLGKTAMPADMLIRVSFPVVREWLFIVAVVALRDLRRDNDDCTFLTLSAQFAV
jgi:hypothetical protein